MIPYGRQSIEEDDIAAVTAALRSDWLTQGPAVNDFEEALATRVEARHAVAFSSGTAALHAAAVAADLGPGDKVATSALTFVASANCARYVGATPVLTDIDPDTLNLDVDRLPQQIDGLIAVHYAGLPVDLRRVRVRPRVVIEDAAHAIGADTPDGPVGNCAHSDMCAFSFHPVKTITAAEGGAVTTNDPELAARLRSFRSHGTVAKPDLGPWAYDVASLGYNYRLSDLHAALGRSQLEKLDRFLTRRADLADRYRERLAHTAITMPPPAPAGFRHGLHLFPIRVDSRDRVYEGLRRRGIGVQVHYVPLYKHSGLRDFAQNGGSSFPCTEEAYQRLLSLPLFPGLADEEQDVVIAAVQCETGS